MRVAAHMISNVNRQKHGRAHDYRGSGAQSQKRAVRARTQRTPKHFPGLNNTICRLINVKLINKVLIES